MHPGNREWLERHWQDFVDAARLPRISPSDPRVLTFRMPSFGNDTVQYGGDVTFRSVRDYEASPCWRLVRSSWHARHEDTGCLICGNTYEIELHHLRYDRIGYSADWEPLDDVVPLCTWHHYETEKRVKAGWPRATAHLPIAHRASTWPRYVD